MAASSSGASSSTSRSASIIPLSNVEAQWERMSSEDQVAVHNQLEELQKKNWKELSLDEKKAAYYVAFGPHGPRAAVNPPGTVAKIIFGTGAAIVFAAVLTYTLKAFAQPPPKTMNKEWQEATNEYAKEHKINPISGVSSEGYTGKGYVTEK
ncbi:hypothetical protein JAAARDRAFT_125168 [Jaapia argillacea MUCL 33604]|uniref:Cytochrome c oxidase subunit IV n=1 Tax=Jaapia argillacea MUCL 33604 TaxID=933084 RepID=A0A067Q566_9AGAM|nr:hypothetical protein JAAARDRAFT_125168 [Jaapia argillacea MUCL 33604]